MIPHSLVAWLMVAAVLPAWRAAAATSAVSLQDPAGDDRGPGGYLPPSSAYVHDGDFDLRRFELTVEGDEAVLKVTLGHRVRRNVVAQRQGRADLDLTTDLAVQNVDIYLDTRRGEGFTKALPGRRVRFPESQAWDTAIVLTPQPQRLKALLRRVWPEADPRILVPYEVRAIGDTVEARLPLAALGGAPRLDWGYSVLVTGAVWDRSFDAFQHLTDTHAETGFVMPVYGVPEENAFGGAAPKGTHPWVIDVLLPEGTSQARVLGDHGRDRLAVVPLVYPGGAEPPRDPAAARDDGRDGRSDGVAARSHAASLADGAPSASAPSAAPASAPRVSDVDENRVVVAVSGADVDVFTMGRVLNDGGAVLARFVVTYVSDTFVVGQVVEGKSQIRVGAPVRFNAPNAVKESP